MKEVTSNQPCTSLKLTSFFILISFSFLLFFFFAPPSTTPFYISQNAPTPTSSFPPPTLTPPPPRLDVERMGIVDSNGFMSDLFKVGDFDAKLVDKLVGNVTIEETVKREIRVVVEKYEICDGKMVDFIPCLDYNLSDKEVNFERHCPEKGKLLNCLVPVPAGYRNPIPWPQSRDEMMSMGCPYIYPRSQQRYVQPTRMGMTNVGMGGPHKDTVAFPEFAMEANHWWYLAEYSGAPRKSQVQEQGA